MIRQPEALLDEHGFVGCQRHFGVARLDELSLALRDPFEHFQLGRRDQGDRSVAKCRDSGARGLQETSIPAARTGWSVGHERRSGSD